MWSISLNRPFGGSLARRITLFVSAMLVAFFAALTIHTTVAQAQIPDEIATWSGENIAYGGQTLERFDRPPSIADERFPNRNNTPCRDSVPLFYSQPLDGPAVRHEGPEYQEDRYWYSIICLSNGSDGSDKSEPINATLLDFSVPKDDVNNNEPTGDDFSTFIQHSIQIYPEGTNPSDINNTADTTTITTCDPEYTQGIGWLICPVTNWMARAMDALYGMLEGFLTVSPVTEDRSLYYVWDIMRNLANILFIIGFLIIIYSQATSIGISNYGIKQLLPRLIIAAVLVNVSYWIVAVAVDISNILGASIKTLFDSVESQIPASENEFMSIRESLTWESVTGFALSGGAAAIGIGGLLVGAALSVGASLYFLVPALMGVIVSALVAILVLAARQAIITVLIVVAPLAFVAYLLPSTERYFERWRSLFTTMLLVFPAFAVVFGGAKLAGTVIINGALDNPDNKNFFNVIVLGMIVQVAPIIITPLLVKLSGSLIGRIAGIVNDPNKGIIDRSRKWAQERHDLRKFGQISEKRNGRYAHNNPFAQAARWKAVRDKNREERIKTYQGGVDAAAAQSRDGHSVHAQQEMNTMLKSTGEDEAKTEFARSIARNISLQRAYTQQQLSHSEAELAENQNKTLIEAMKAKPGVANVAIRDLADRVHKTTNDALDETQRQSSITQEHDNQYWKELAEDPTRQAHAGAAGIAEYGETRIINIAQQKQVEERTKRVNAAISTLDKNEAKLSEELAVILGDAANAGEFAYLTSDPDARSGALRRFIDRAPIKLVQELSTKLDITAGANGDQVAELLRSELAAAFKKRRPFYVSMTNLNKIEEGSLSTKYYGVDGQNLMIQETLNAKGLGTQTMVQADRDDLQAVRDYIRTRGINSLDASAQDALRSSLRTAFKDNRYRSQMDKRAIELGEIWDNLGMGPIPDPDS